MKFALQSQIFYFNFNRSLQCRFNSSHSATKWHEEFTCTLFVLQLSSSIVSCLCLIHGSWLKVDLPQDPCTLYPQLCGEYICTILYLGGVSCLIYHPITSFHFSLSPFCDRQLERNLRGKNQSVVSPITTFPKTRLCLPTEETFYVVFTINRLFLMSPKSFFVDNCISKFLVK